MWPAREFELFSYRTKGVKGLRKRDDPGTARRARLPPSHQVARDVRLAARLALPADRSERIYFAPPAGLAWPGGCCGCSGKNCILSNVHFPDGSLR